MGEKINAPKVLLGILRGNTPLGAGTHPRLFLAVLDPEAMYNLCLTLKVML
jgi:hypothetical protein